MADNRVFLNMERYIQLKKILSDVTVPYAVIKGEPLSLLCYNKKSVRNSQDIDILIDRQMLRHFVLQKEKRILTIMVWQKRNVNHGKWIFKLGWKRIICTSSFGMT